MTHEEAAQAGVVFQSTPPARGATRIPNIEPTLQHNFNPRPPRGGRQRMQICLNNYKLRFQSTPPARGATRAAAETERQNEISIHAPREGGDCMFIQRGATS